MWYSGIWHTSPLLQFSGRRWAATDTITHTHDTRTRTHSLPCKLMYDILLVVLWALGNAIATAALCNLCSFRPACLRKVASPRISPSATPYARPQEMREGAASTSMPTMCSVSDAVLGNLPRGTECEIRVEILSFWEKPFHLFE